MTKHTTAPRFLYRPEAWWQMHYLTLSCPIEISAMGVVAKDNPCLVERFYVVKQECSSVLTEMDSLALMELTKKLGDEGIDPERICVWFHSHVDMDTGPSGTDENNIDRYAPHTHLWSVINNKKCAREAINGGFPTGIYTRLDLFDPDGRKNSPLRRSYEKCSYQVLHKTEDYGDWADKEVKDKVTRSASYTARGGNWGNQYRSAAGRVGNSGGNGYHQYGGWGGAWDDPYNSGSPSWPRSSSATVSAVPPAPKPEDAELDAAVLEALAVFLQIKMISKGTYTKKANKIHAGGLHGAETALTYLHSKWMRYPNMDDKEFYMAASLYRCYSPEREMYEDDTQQEEFMLRFGKLEAGRKDREAAAAEKAVGGVYVHTEEKKEEAKRPSLQGRIKELVTAGKITEDEAIVYAGYLQKGELTLEDLHEVFDEYEGGIPSEKLKNKLRRAS